MLSVCCVCSVCSVCVWLCVYVAFRASTRTGVEYYVGVYTHLVTYVRAVSERAVHVLA